MSSLYEVDGPLPDTIGQIQQVTENQEAVMSFYYTGDDNQVKKYLHLYVLLQFTYSSFPR